MHQQKHAVYLRSIILHPSNIFFSILLNNVSLNYKIKTSKSLFTAKIKTFVKLK